MTGQDLFFWLEDIWVDLVIFEQADVLSLAFRLIVLVVYVVILWGLAKSLIKTASQGFAPIWRVIMAPGRSFQRHSRARKHQKEHQKKIEAREQEQREQEARDKVQQKEQEKKRQEELDAVKTALVID